MRSKGASSANGGSKPNLRKVHNTYELMAVYYITWYVDCSLQYAGLGTRYNQLSILLGFSLITRSAVYFARLGF